MVMYILEITENLTEDHIQNAIYIESYYDHMNNVLLKMATTDKEDIINS